MATTWRQDVFAFRNDDGSQSTATWTSGCANLALGIYGDRNIRIRIEVSEQGTTAATLTPWLWIQRNGAGGYYSASACTGSGIYPALSSNFADGDATTQQISSVTYVAGTMDEVDGKCGATASIARYSGTEHEYNLKISASTITDGDYFDFREYNQATPLTTYTSVGRLTLNKWAGANSAAQAQTAENITLINHPPTFTLQMQNASQMQSTDAIILTYHEASTSFILEMQSASQMQNTDAIQLTQHQVIGVADAKQSQIVGTLSLTQHHLLAVNNVFQTQSTDAIQLTQHYRLGVADAKNVQTVENLTLSYHPAGANAIVVTDARQMQTAGNIDLVQHFAAVVLVIAATTQYQRVDAVTFPTPPADVFVGSITHATTSITRGVISKTTPSIVRTASSITKARVTVEKKKGY